jgi:hypothetical protein
MAPAQPLSRLDSAVISYLFTAPLFLPVQCRPEFEGELRMCPYLNQPERYYPWRRRAGKVAVATLVLGALAAASASCVIWLFRFVSLAKLVCYGGFDCARL